MMQDNENLSVDPKGRVEGNGRDGGSTGARQDMTHMRRETWLEMRKKNRPQGASARGGRWATSGGTGSSPVTSESWCKTEARM